MTKKSPKTLITNLLKNAGWLLLGVVGLTAIFVLNWILILWRPIVFAIVLVISANYNPDNPGLPIIIGISSILVIVGIKIINSTLLKNSYK